MPTVPPGVSFSKQNEKRHFRLPATTERIGSVQRRPYRRLPAGLPGAARETRSYTTNPCRSAELRRQNPRRAMGEQRPQRRPSVRPPSRAAVRDSSTAPHRTASQRPRSPARRSHRRPLLGSPLRTTPQPSAAAVTRSAARPGAYGQDGARTRRDTRFLPGTRRLPLPGQRSEGRRPPQAGPFPAAALTCRARPRRGQGAGEAAPGAAGGGGGAERSRGRRAGRGRGGPGGAALSSWRGRRKCRVPGRENGVGAQQ